MTDQRSSSRLAPPGLTPAGPGKRLPGPRAVRRRYKLARWVSLGVGGFVAAVVTEAALADLTARKLVPDLTFYAVGSIAKCESPTFAGVCTSEALFGPALSPARPRRTTHPL